MQQKGLSKGDVHGLIPRLTNIFHTQRLKDPVCSHTVWIPILIQHSGSTQSCRTPSKISIETVPDGNCNLFSCADSTSVSLKYIYF